MAVVAIEHLTKRFDLFSAVDDVSLYIEHGLFVSLLGPSGCGKTTVLRLVAGFLAPDRGSVRVGDRLISSPEALLPPERRNMSMIFQSYALWPHMTIAENVAYGLKLRRLPRSEVEQRVASILTVTRLSGLALRYPADISGG